MSEKVHLPLGGEELGTQNTKVRVRWPTGAATIIKPNETQTHQSLGPIRSDRGPLPSPFPVINYKAAQGEPTGSRTLNQREKR